MGVLREIEGQHERFGTGVLDFNSTTRKGRLRNESDLWVDLAKLHVLIVTDFELSNATASSIGVEQCGAPVSYTHLTLPTSDLV